MATIAPKFNELETRIRKIGRAAHVKLGDRFLTCEDPAKELQRVLTQPFKDQIIERDQKIATLQAQVEKLKDNADTDLSAYVKKSKIIETIQAVAEEYGCTEKITGKLTERLHALVLLGTTLADDTEDEDLTFDDDDLSSADAPAAEIEPEIIEPEIGEVALIIEGEEKKPVAFVAPDEEEETAEAPAPQGLDEEDEWEDEAAEGDVLEEFSPEVGVILKQAFGADEQISDIAPKQAEKEMTAPRKETAAEQFMRESAEETSAAPRVTLTLPNKNSGGVLQEALRRAREAELVRNGNKGQKFAVSSRGGQPIIRVIRDRKE